MKYQFMQEHQHDFKIERMSQVLNVARGGYYPHIAIPHESPHKYNLQPTVN